MEKNKTLKRTFLSWGLPLIIITSYGLLSIQGDLRFSIPLLIAISACNVIVLSTALYFGEKKEISWSPLVIVSVAIIVRCFYLFRTPELSDDIYRYLWDGLQILQGNNPYTFAPLQTQPFDIVSSNLLKKINHPELVTIYPPAAQLIFLIGAFLTKSVTGIKASLCIIDLATCIVIIKILSHMELPVWRTALYAWHPIPVLEIASSGHIDGAGIFFFLLTIYFLQSAMMTGRSRSLRNENAFIFISGFSFGIAALVKLYPLFLIPVFLVMMQGMKRLLFSLGVIFSIAILTIPFMPDLCNIFDTLGIYLKNWEFSNSAFRTLRDFTASGDIARFILAFLFICVTGFCTIRLLRKRAQKRSNDISLNISGNKQQDGPAVFKDIFTDSLKSLYCITFAFLLLTPTLYPWYVLFLVCLFPFITGPAGIIFSWSVFLSYYILIYYVYLGNWVENSIIPALIWGAPVLSILINKCLQYRYRQK